MVTGESPATNAETRVLEDDNLNFMSPIGDDECLFSSFVPDTSVSVIPLAIRRAIPELSKLHRILGHTVPGCS